MLSKEALRAKFAAERPSAQQQGRLAEAVRQLAAYRQASRLFISPAPELTQVRINALLDGKEVLLPGPGLREGFYLLTPFSVPFRELPFAVSFKGMASHGRLQELSRLADSPIELLLTEALAVDARGGRLGDGSGFFDLSCAILAHLGGLAEQVSAIAVLANDRRLVEPLPMEPWDVAVQGIVSPRGFQATDQAFGVAGIIWDALPARASRKMSPLWKIRQQLAGWREL